MNVLIEKAIQVKHNGGSECADVCGRGLKHRVFDSNLDRLDEAADVATGVRRYVPTLNETAENYGLSLAELREHLKVRAAAQVQADTFEHISPIAELIRAWNAATANDREWFVREVGVDTVWDAIAEIIR